MFWKNQSVMCSFESAFSAWKLAWSPFALTCGWWAVQREGSPVGFLCPAAAQDSSRDPLSSCARAKPAPDLDEQAWCGYEVVSQQPCRVYHLPFYYHRCYVNAVY